MQVFPIHLDWLPFLAVSSSIGETRMCEYPCGVLTGMPRSSTIAVVELDGTAVLVLGFWGLSTLASRVMAPGDVPTSSV